jgi:hypothetical protein
MVKEEMKVEVEDLTGLFMVIENTVNERKMPEQQKPKWIRILQIIAKAAYDLGKNGKCELEI